MKVSICIPAYGNSDGVKRLLDSVRVQKYTDYEVIITDDSPDDSVKEVVGGYESIDKEFAEKIIYGRNIERLGASGNWNHSIDISKGDYIKIMHHDDWFSDENSLGEFVKMLDENPKAVLAFSGTYQVDMDTNDSYSRAILPNDLEELKKDYRYLYIAQVIGAPSATIYRKTDLRFAKELSWLVDAEFYMKVFRKAAADNNGYSEELFAYSLEPLISIGVSETQLTESVRDDMKLNLYEYDFVMKEFGLEDEEPFASKMQSVKYKASRKYKFTAPIQMTKDKVKAMDLKYIGKLSFYIGLTIELLILILEKSSYINPYESWMFRIAFGFFIIKCLCTRYSLRDFIIIGILGVTSVIGYKINHKDELVRIAVFVVAMKDMDLKRTLKYVFGVTMTGMGILILLSLTGLLGTVFDIGEGFGSKAGVTRLCLGLGSANTLSIMVWVLMTLGIYLYHEKLEIWHYAVLGVLSVVVYLITVTRTSLLLSILTIALAVLFTKVKVLQKSKICYALGALEILGCTAASIWAAKVSAWHEFMTPFQNKVDRLLTGRIQSLYAYVDGGGRIENWLPFSNPNFEDYFDMGYVKMFYWFGIIPATLALIILLYMIYQSYKRSDYMGLVVIMVVSLFTLVEAHFVSVYIARNYLLFMAGAYIFTTRSVSSRKGFSK